MIDKIISWVFMLIFITILVVLTVGCWVTFQDEAYAFSGIFATLVSFCIIMILIVYKQDFFKMKTVKYTSHTIKTTNGKYISCKKEVEAILSMLYSGEDETTIDGQTVSLSSDKIVTEGKDVKRLTVVKIGDSICT